MNGPAPAPDVVIVGAGISGLSLAHFLTRKGLRVEVHEASAEAGGSIRTTSHDGFLYDVGPDSFVRQKPEAEKLCRELGLGADLIEPEPEGRRVYVALDGALHPMPEGLSLGVPTEVRSLLETKLLSDVGKLRALCEPFVMVPEPWPQDESIHDFLTRRVGKEMAERIAAPLLSGVFAGDAARLSAQAAFPQLVGFERGHGSLFFGMMAARAPGDRSWAKKLSWLLKALWPKPKPSLSPFYSLRAGLGQLVTRLVSDLQGSGEARLYFESPVQRLTVNGGRVRGVVLRSGREIQAEHIVLAGPPWAAAEVVGPGHPGLFRALREKKGAPTATVFFGLTDDRLEQHFRGSGFIVPPGEGEILAATFTDQKWAGRAPEGKALVRAFLGGARKVGPNLDAASDSELVETSRRELERFVGELGQPLFTRVYRYARGTPQPELGHDDWRHRVRRLEDELGGLYLTGPGYSGVGIPDCIRAAAELAERLGRRELSGAELSGAGPDRSLASH